MKQLHLFLSAFLIVTLCLSALPQTHASNGSAETLTFSMKVLDASLAPVTTPLTIRFSFWSSSDWDDSDIVGGEINEAAATFVGWSEEQTVTPAANGYFSIFVGAVNPLPTFDASRHIFMQTDLKGAAQDATSYQLIDPTGDDGVDSVDRRTLNSFVYAQNTRTIDGYAVGTGSGDVLLLGPNGRILPAQMGSGTTAASFTINANNQSGDTALRFGNDVLPETILFSAANHRFEFSDSVYIAGDLTVTGRINGLSQLAPLHVTAASGLRVDIASGSYRINGSLVQYPGAEDVAVVDAATNTIFFTALGLTVNQSGFPTDKSFIPLATVVTSGGAIVSVTDRRALQSDTRDSEVKLVLHAPFPGASIKADGSSNVGQLFATLDSINEENYYLWSSTQSTLQDYDLSVAVTLPLNFVAWEATPLTVRYRSTSADAAVNKLDVTMSDTAAQPVTLTGQSTGLVSLSWADASLDFSGSNTWTPGGTFFVKFKLAAKDTAVMHLGDVQLHYRTLQ